MLFLKRNVKSDSLHTTPTVTDSAHSASKREEDVGWILDGSFLAEVCVEEDVQINKRRTF